MSTQYAWRLPDSPMDIARVGGKGASLVRLVSAGLPVPPGFCLATTAYDRFVADNGLGPRIEGALSSVDPDDTQALEKVSNEIAKVFDEGWMPEDVAAAVAGSYASLPGSDPAVAVRSSATAEDLPGLSFAGQYETYLNVQGFGAVLAAVEKCWASLWTARAIAYRLRHGIDQSTVSLAVIVQCLVPAKAAGVLFTANPVTGAQDEAVISAAWGLGEAIVSGLVTPDTITVEKATGRVRSQIVADKERMSVRVDGGTREQPVPAGLRSAAVLDERAAAELVRLGTQIEALY